MKLAADWLATPGSRAVMAMLAGGGHKAAFVGGCVRNALMGLPVTDLDIATDARPERVLDLAGAQGLKAVGTGLEHGTVTVIADGVAFEITTFRHDLETDGRRAVVAFSDRLEEDAARRDFTMNALYAEADGTVLDPTGEGLGDLAARRLRFVGAPEARITEDFLRILRFFRFHALYADPEFGFDAEILAAISSLSGGLETISRERIGHEMRKLLAARDPAPALATMAQTGVLRLVLPGSDPVAVAPLVHLEGQVDMAPAWLRRLAVLGGQDVADALRLSKPEAKGFKDRRAAIELSDSPAALGYRFGAEIARDAVVLRAVFLEQPLAPDALDKAATGAEHVFPVTAADLMPDLQGPALGERLRQLETRWIASGFALSRDDLLQ